MTTSTREITNGEDIIDLRDVIARFEYLEDAEDWGDEGELTERAALEALLDACRGNGGDEDWRGDWYPATLIRDSYFRDYAQELAEGVGAINSDATWPNNCIDWDQATRELQMDYTSISFDGIDYWTR